MTFAKFSEYVRWRLKKDTNTLGDAELLLIANVHKDKLAEKIAKINEDYFVVPATADLVADQREYPFPSDVLNNMKALEIKFSASASYIRAVETDLNDHNISTDEASIVEYFNNNNPYFDIIRNSLWIFSGTIPAVTAGLKLWFTAFIADFTNMASGDEMGADPTTTTFGLPRQFQPVLADILVKDYKIKHGIKMDKVDNDVDKTTQEALDSITNANLDRSVIAQLPTSSNIGDDGFDY